MFKLTKLITIKSCQIINYRQLARRVVQQNIVRINRSTDNNQESMRDFILPEYSYKHVDDGFNKFSDKCNKQEKKEFNIPKYEKNNNHSNNVFSKEIIKTVINKDKSNTIVMEGKRLINDAIENNLKITHIFFSCKDDLEDIVDLKRLVETEQIKLIKVTYKEMKIYSTLKTPPGIMAIVKKPNEDELQAIYEKRDFIPLILICDNVRDPGNMGTIIRTSAAAGIEKIILTDGCVDIWNQKVIKSAAGAHFKIPIIQKIKWDDMVSMLPQTFDLYVADAKDFSGVQKFYPYDKVNYFSKNIDNTKVLVIGNEAFGLSSKCYEFVDKFNGSQLKIPLSNNSESLNSAIASAILLYEIRRQFELKN